MDAWTETEKQLNGEVPNFTVLICALILPRSDKYCCCLPFNKDVLVKCKIGAYKTRALVATKERYKPEGRLNKQTASGDCGNLE